MSQSPGEPYSQEAVDRMCEKWADSLPTQMWFEEEHRSIITITPVQGGGTGFDVRVTTNQPAPKDYLRPRYCSSIIDAAERVLWLQTEVLPGTWKKA
jgi:hypothetical protein